MVDFAKRLVKCVHCGEPKMRHRPTTLACKLKQPGGRGQTIYHLNNVFTPPDKK